MAIADYTDKPNNNSISWNHLEDNKSIDDVNSNDNNDQETAPTYRTVPHRPTPPPPRQLDISSFSTQNTHGLHQQPCDADGKPLIHKPHNYKHYKHLIVSMKTKHLDTSVHLNDLKAIGVGISVVVGVIVVYHKYSRID